MKEQVFVFVYSRDNKIEVLGLKDSKEQHDKLLLAGWKHTATLDACAFIQYLHNDSENLDLVDEIKSLSEVSV